MRLWKEMSFWANIGEMDGGKAPQEVRETHRMSSWKDFIEGREGFPLRKAY